MRRALLIAAVVAGALAPFAGSPYRTSEAPDVARLAALVEAEQDHVTAIELARWIHDRKPNLRVIDIRTAKEFHEYHVPSSRHVPLAELVRAPVRANDTVVLISDGGAHAAQAWVFLQTLGYRDVYFLRGGLQEWLDEVMQPVTAPPAHAELSRYFGGSPRRGDGTDRTDGTNGTHRTVEKIRRRGC